MSGRSRPRYVGVGVSAHIIIINTYTAILMGRLSISFAMCYWGDFVQSQAAKQKLLLEKSKKHKSSKSRSAERTHKKGKKSKKYSSSEEEAQSDSSDEGSWSSSE